MSISSFVAIAIIGLFASVVYEFTVISQFIVEQKRTATTSGVTLSRSARQRSHLYWPRPAPASGSTSIWKATARPSSL